MYRVRSHSCKQYPNCRRIRRNLSQIPPPRKKSEPLSPYRCSVSLGHGVRHLLIDLRDSLRLVTLLVVFVLLGELSDQRVDLLRRDRAAR